MENIPTQIWERNTLWHKKATKGVGIMVGFAFLLLFFALHLTFSFLFIVVFMRSLNHLTEVSGRPDGMQGTSHAPQSVP